jgi:phosphoribosylformylglycinamidine synthase
LFGEDQARYIVTAAPEKAEAIRIESEKAGVPCAIIGSTGGSALILGETAILVEDLRRGYESWLPAYMAGEGR